MNSANLYAFTIQTRQLPDLYFLGETLGPKYLSRVKGADKLCTRLATGTSVVSGVVSIAVYLSIDNPSWGDKAQLTVGLASSVLSAIPPTTYLGVSIGMVDVFGGFDGWYDAWNSSEKIYNSYGVAILPITYPGTFTPVTIMK